MSTARNWAAIHKARMPKAPSYPNPYVPPRPKRRGEDIERPPYSETWIDWVDAHHRSKAWNETRPKADLPDGLKREDSL